MRYKDLLLEQVCIINVAPWDLFDSWNRPLWLWLVSKVYTLQECSMDSLITWGIVKPLRLCADTVSEDIPCLNTSLTLPQSEMFFFPRICSLPPPESTTKAACPTLGLVILHDEFTTSCKWLILQRHNSELHSMSLLHIHCMAIKKLHGNMRLLLLIYRPLKRWTT
jgi:hypothetical protein